MAHRREHHNLKQRLSRQQELWLYFVGGALVLSGVGWLVCHYSLRAPGPAPHPLEPWWLRLHGAAVVGFLVVFGTLLPRHVKHGWRQGLNRGSGLPVVIATAFLALTGYGLYYIVSDELRDWVSVVHWTVGLAAVAAVGVHIALGKQLARLRRLDAERKLAVRLAARHSSGRVRIAP
jgi:cation transport ATPase